MREIYIAEQFNFLIPLKSVDMDLLKKCSAYYHNNFMYNVTIGSVKFSVWCKIGEM